MEIRLRCQRIQAISFRGNSWSIFPKIFYEKKSEYPKRKALGEKKSLNVTSFQKKKLKNSLKKSIQIKKK